MYVKTYSFTTGNGLIMKYVGDGTQFPQKYGNMSSNAYGNP